MARKKVTLAFMSNDSERKASYKKRKPGLVKKAHELSTLCGVNVGVALFSQYEKQPVLWPSESQVISMFSSLTDVSPQNHKMFDQEAFLVERTKKAKDKLSVMRKENTQKDMNIFMYKCIAEMATLRDFNFTAYLDDMNAAIVQIQRDIKYRMEVMGYTNDDEASTSAPVLTAQPANTVEENFPWDVVEGLTTVGPNTNSVFSMN